MPASSGTVQSIDRIFSIIETLSSYPQGMLLSDLAEATSLHVSTAHRLVQMLVHHGYAFKDPLTGKYRLSLRLYEIGSRVSNVFGLLSQARPLLDQLASFTKEAVHLVERDGNDVVYLYKAEPYQQFVRMGSHVGLRNPMYCTGVGKSILASLPENEVFTIWEQSQIQAYTDYTITDYPSLLEELRNIRCRGFAIDEQEHELGVRCIAAPICNWQGTPVAAISISAPVTRLDADAIERYSPELLKITHELSQMLGNLL